VLKLGNVLKGDHVTDFWGWIERFITQSLVYKCSYVNDTIKGGLMMWVSFAINGNKQEMKWLAIKHKALKWDEANSAFLMDHLDGFPWQMGWLWHRLHDYDDYKIREIQMHMMHKQKGRIVGCFHLLHKVFKIWPLLTPNFRHLRCLVEEERSWVEGPRCIWCHGLLLHSYP
jgi:hypothetical protein